MHTAIPRPGHTPPGRLFARAAGAAAAVGLLLAAAAPAHAATTKAYTKPGTYTFTVPAGISQIRVVLTGAGGRGGAEEGTPWRYSGGGGGGGATATCILDVRPGNSLTVTVGAGGGTGAGPKGGNSTISYPNADGASAEGGQAGHLRYNGAGGSSAVWCAGANVRLTFGHNGYWGRAPGEGAGAGGAPGDGVHPACPAGTGTGGKGMESMRGDVLHPGGPGCVVLTY